MFRFVVKLRAAALCIGAALLALLPSTAHARDGNATTWHLQVSGMSKHFGEPRQAGKTWNEVHDGLGLERASQWRGFPVRASVGFMRDSFNHQGAYVGGSIGWRAIDGDVSADLSLAPMLLYRTVRFDDHRGKAPYKLIPAVLPTISVTHHGRGIGAHLVALPAGNFGKDFRFPALVFLQFTYQIR